MGRIRELCCREEPSAGSDVIRQNAGRRVDHKRDIFLPTIRVVYRANRRRQFECAAIANRWSVQTRLTALIGRQTIHAGIDRSTDWGQRKRLRWTAVVREGEQSWVGSRLVGRLRLAGTVAIQISAE